MLSDQIMSKIIYPYCLSLICACLLTTPPALAELGGAVNKEATQIQELSPIVATEQHLNVFQLKLASGTQIKEFVNAENIVVAVTWQGPTLPNLQTLLGEHFQTFSNRPVAHSANHRSAELRTDDLVVQSHGQMRNFAGKAYLPKLMPAGFTADQIK